MACVTPGVQVDVKSSREGSEWELLTLDESLSIWDRVADVPSVENFICISRKCRKEKDLTYAKRLHAHVCNNGLEAHRAVGNYVVPMFVACGSASDGQQVFNRLTDRAEHSWTSLILGYIECGQAHHALSLYQNMQEDNVLPSRYTLMALIKACARLKDIERGQKIHAEIAEKGFGSNLFASSAVVDMYAKCGSLSDAQEVFDKLPVRNVVLWNALIAGYAEHGHDQEALQCIGKMQQEDVSPNAVTFICALKACGSMASIVKGREIHAEIAQKGFEVNLFVGNSLVDMYAKCGSLSEAQEVFDKLRVRDVVSWTALIAGYAEFGPGQEALKCFKLMQLERVSADAITFVCVLEACGSMGAVGKGQGLHAEIAQKGFERDLSVGNALADMYAKCGSLSKAQEVFGKLPIRNVVSWSSMIAGYAEHGPFQEAVKSFEQMQLEGVSPNAITFICALKACGRMGALLEGQEVHAQISQKGCERDLVVGSSLVDMYAKCGSLSEAQEAFNKLLGRNVVSWNALIAGYAEHGSGQEALRCFEQMQWEGSSPNAATFACFLKACGSMGALSKGREIHVEITQKGFDQDLFVSSSLVDMYAKCGSLTTAWESFDRQPVRNIVSWNTMMKGYVLNHDGNLAIECFDDLQEQGVEPNTVTFTSLLTACSHSNLIFKGQEYFKVLIEEFCIAPTLEHYTCVVDLLARSGHLYEAEEFLEIMWCPPCGETWTALLSACKAFGEAELGVRCFQQLVQINPKSAASYVHMANIYSSARSREDAYKIDYSRHILSLAGSSLD